jgi:corrinoid protein of di/trimethylamine methyltransferase
MSTELFEKMKESIIDGDTDLAEELANQAVAEGVDPLEAINKGFVVGVNLVGERFSCGEMFLPELVMAGEAMKAAISILEVELAKLGVARDMLGTVVIGTVQGDIHDIGKTLVSVMLSVAGFEVIDMGVDVAVEEMVARAREVNADIVAMSALLTTTMIRQRDVIEALEDVGIRDKVKVMVGGAPVTRAWVEEIAADGYSEDAIGAVQVAKQLLGIE